VAYKYWNIVKGKVGASKHPMAIPGCANGVEAIHETTFSYCIDIATT
jgi:hypothetical protein